MRSSSFQTAVSNQYILRYLLMSRPNQHQQLNRRPQFSPSTIYLHLMMSIFNTFMSSNLCNKNIRNNHQVCDLSIQIHLSPCLESSMYLSTDIIECSSSLINYCFLEVEDVTAIKTVNWFSIPGHKAYTTPTEYSRDS